MKKGTARKTADDTTNNTQESFNSVYTAHQVHTLAQIVYQRLSGGWQAPGPWTSHGETGFSPSSCMSGPTTPVCGTPWSAGPFRQGQGFAPPAAPPSFHWYP